LNAAIGHDRGKQFFFSVTWSECPRHLRRPLVPEEETTNPPNTLIIMRYFKEGGG
jgi:hypothetical protein